VLGHAGGPLIALVDGDFGVTVQRDGEEVARLEEGGIHLGAGVGRDAGAFQPVEVGVESVGTALLVGPGRVAVEEAVDFGSGGLGGFGGPLALARGGGGFGGGR